MVRASFRLSGTLFAASFSNIRVLWHLEDNYEQKVMIIIGWKTTLNGNSAQLLKELTDHFIVKTTLSQNDIPFYNIMPCITLWLEMPKPVLSTLKTNSVNYLQNKKKKVLFCQHNAFQMLIALKLGHHVSTMSQDGIFVYGAKRNIMSYQDLQ